MKVTFSARCVRLTGLVLVLAVAGCGWAEIARAAECLAKAPAVRLMIHEPSVLTARIAMLGNAPDEPTARRAAFRKLFEAAGCTQISEQGDSERSKNVECRVAGTGSGEIVVGVSQAQDSLGSAAVLASLAESLAAAPRHHTLRWVAFSPANKHDGKPKGGARLLGALAEHERRQVHAMVHVGPLGFGPASGHPSAAGEKLRCALDTAAAALGGAVLWEAAKERIKTRRCFAQGYAVAISCPQNQQLDWTGAKDWETVRRAGIPLIGVHSGDPDTLTAELDGEAYYKAYRLLAVALALIDDALAAGGAAASESLGAAATSPR